MQKQKTENRKPEAETIIKKLVRQLRKMSWKTGEQQEQKGKWSNLKDK